MSCFTLALQTDTVVISISTVTVTLQMIHTTLQAALMDLVPNDKARGLKTPVWDEYKKLMKAAEGKEVMRG